VEDPFDGELLPPPVGLEDRRQIPSMLRKRRGEGKHEVIVERLLSFAADRLLLSDDGELLVAASDDQIEVFTAPDWKSAAKWSFPQPQKRSRFDDPIRRELQLSPDGELLVAAPERSYGFPTVYKTRSGERVRLSSGHSNQIVAVDFAKNGELRTLDADGVILRWSPATGEPAPHLAEDARQLTRSGDPWDRRRQTEHVAEDGRYWQFVGQGGGKYQRFESFEVRVFPQGVKPTDGVINDKPRQKGESRGVIEPQWGAYTWVGLVPGGEYLHVGTQIFSRRDLKPVSATNVSGELDQLIFSADGSRYALLTSERESRPTGLGPGIVRREEVSQRLRVHDTRTGQTRLSVDCPTHVRLIALSPDGSRLASVNEKQEAEVWEVLP
jgi:WD40 repeat protein